MPELNEYMELVKMPGYFSEFLVKAVLLDLGCAFGVEYICSYLFSDNTPVKSLGLDDLQWEHIGKVVGADGRVRRGGDELIVKAPEYRIKN